MASFKQYTASGGASEAFSIPTFSSDEIKVYVDNVLKTATTHYNITSYTANGGTVTWTSGNVPASPAVVRIVRDTGVTTARATYAAGSSVKAGDLNDNQTQVLRSLEEQDDQLIQTYDVQDSAITTAKIKADNITSALIADDQINSEHYVDGSIDTAHIADSQVTTVKIADSNITTAKIAADAVTAAKIADDVINSEHYAAGSIDTEHIADSQVTTDKVANSAITAAKIANDALTGSNMVAGTITTVKLADDAVTSDKLANNIDIAGTLDVTGTGTFDSDLNLSGNNHQFLVEDASGDNKFTVDSDDGNTWIKGTLTVVGGTTLSTLTTSSNATVGGTLTCAGFQISGSGLVSSDLITNTSSPSTVGYDLGASGRKWDNCHFKTVFNYGDIQIGSSSSNTVTLNSKIGSNILPTGTRDIGGSSTRWNKVWTTDLDVANGQLNTLGGMQSGTASILASGTALTSTTAELNLLDGKSIVTTISGSSTDVQLPTAKAVNDAVTGLNLDNGNYVPINNEVSFPNSNPDPGNDAGTIVSIADAGGIVVNGSGVSTTGRTVGGSTVTINGIDSSLYNTTIAAGKGMLVQTTSTLNTYDYHRLVVDEAGVATAQSLVTSFNERYRVGSSNPSSNNDAGDLFFNTATDKLLVRNAANNSWDEAQSVGNFYISTLSPAFDGSTTDFTITNAPTYASQILLIINGVLQKPNAGTSAPADGFAIDGSTIKLGGAPATGSTYSAVVIGSTVNIGTPSNNTVSTAIIQNLAVNTDKIAADAVTGAKIADDAVGSEHIEVLDAALQFGDSVKAQFGAGNDLEVYHDGTHSFIKSTTGLLKIGDGNVRIMNAACDEDMIHAKQNEGVELYYDNSKTFETVATGIQVQGAEDGHGEIYLFADEGDDNADKYLLQSGTDNAFYIKNYTSGSWEVNLKTTGNGAVELYYDNVKKLETQTRGVTLTGTTTNTLEILGVGGHQLYSYHDSDGVGFATGLDSSWGELIYFDEANGDIEFYAEGVVCANMIGAGAVELYHNGNKKLETMADGIQIHAEEASEAIIQFHPDQGDDNADYWRIRTGNSGTGFFSIENYGDGSWNSQFFAVPNGRSELLYDDAAKVETTSTGIKVSGSDTGDQIKIVASGTNANGVIDFESPGTGGGIIKTRGTSRIHIDTEGTGDIYLGGAAGAGPINSGSNKTGFVYDNDGGGNHPFIGIQQASKSGAAVVYVNFECEGAQRGSITQHNSGNDVNYGSASDYRLKQDEVLISDGITRLKQLKPYQFKWKDNVEYGYVDGFFAHEVDDVVKGSATGTKDEVVTQESIDNGTYQIKSYKAGDPVYQNLDYSKMTPLLTAALKEAITKIETLETKVAALEAK